MEGPFELHLRLAPNHQASLLLPFDLNYGGGGGGHQLNTSHTHLKRVLVGEGINVQVPGIQEISLFHTFSFGWPANESDVKYKNSGYWPFRHSFVLYAITSCACFRFSIPCCLPNSKS